MRVTTSSSPCRPCPVCGSTRTKCWLAKDRGEVYLIFKCFKCGYENKKLVGFTR